MSEISERYRKVAAAFTDRVSAVPDQAWDNPAPCEGWVARDVVRHLVEWLPAYVATWGVEVQPHPSVDEDPIAAWRAVDQAMQGALDDPEMAGLERDTRMGRAALATMVDTICTPDVLIHTWDLARATGLDETLDPEEVHRFVESMEPYDEVLRTSGHYGPRTPVPEDADEQTRLIAFVGRRP